jgi:peptidoglycan/LPS O-acetylase OafA/YrhL
VGGRSFVEAGQIAGSSWLQHYGGAPYVPKVDLWAAFLQGTVFTFFRGDFTYDSVFWTMRLELTGSFVVFMLAPLLARAPGRILPFAIAAMVSIVLERLEPRLTEFVIGAMLAWLVARGLPEMKLSLALPLFVIAMFCLGYYAPRGAYGWLPFKAGSFYVWDAGAVLTILVVLRNRHFRAVLSGGWARWIGSMSFPIYLVHTPILCVVGSWTFLALYADAGPRNAIATAYIVTLAVVMPSALALRAFERFWVSAVNRVSYWVLPYAPRVGT